MPPSSMQSLNEAPALTPPPPPPPPCRLYECGKKTHPVGYGTRTSALFNSAALAGLPWLSPGADPAGHLCNTEDLAFARCWASVVCGYWDTYEGQDLVGSELVERLVAGGIFANPRMTRCRPALDTASSWERCQRAKLRRPQHALGEPCFDQLLSGLRRSARHSRSVKGGGASNPVSNVSMPSWCHLNHPSTAPPALGRRTCRWQCVFRFGSWDCRASVYRYQPPCSQVHQDPRHQEYWRRGSGAAPCTDIMDESCYASVAPSRPAAGVSLPHTCVYPFPRLAVAGCPAADETQQTWT